MKRLIMALTVAAIGLAYSGTAQAAFTQTATGSMNISSTILSYCTVATTPMAFGGYTGATIVHVQSTITVNCSTGTIYRIDIDAGQNLVGTDVLPRRMKTGTAPASYTNALTYDLNKTTNWATIGGDWGDNGATFCTTCTTPRTGKDGVGIGADEIHTVYGTIGTTTLAPGTYTDTVVVTVNY